MAVEDQIQAAHDLIKKGTDLVKKGENMLKNIVESCRVEQKKTSTKSKLSNQQKQKLLKRLG